MGAAIVNLILTPAGRCREIMHLYDTRNAR